MSSRTSPRNNSSPRDPPPRPSTASHMHPIDLGARGIADMALPPTLLQEKNNPFHIDTARCDGSDYPQDPTIPRDNGSPGDTPPRPSRAPTVSARGCGSVANMALPPTPNNQQQKPFPIDAARFPIDPNDALLIKRLPRQDR
jgi:hypothetical protein